MNDRIREVLTGLRQWCSARIPYILIAAALYALTFSNIALVLPLDMVQIIYAAIAIVCIAGIIVMPLPASFGLGIVSIIGTLLPMTVTVPNPLLTLFAVLGILGYSSRLWICLLMLAVESVGVVIIQVVWHYDTGMDMYGVINSLAMLGCAIFVGYALRWRKQVDLNRIDKMRLEHLQMRNRIAADIHDSTTANLTKISQIAQHNIHTGGCENHAWSDVNRLAVSTLRDIYKAIDLLSNEDSRQIMPSHGTFMEHLEDVTDTEDALLQNLGFRGKTEISGVAEGISVQQEDVLLSLMREIYRNIQRHGNPNGTYKVVITIGNGRLLIAQSNEIHPVNDWHIPHGRGIRLHNKQIELLGGKMQCWKKSRQWHLTVCVPLVSESES